ncbi:MAG: lipopolysaccharide heptosyltransferase II [Pseudomonadota bacterium]|nr:lipopolysaccharide heptosyltransferase II [Pseudomonadota bacterium]|tara:strand:- start:214 stop:1245 length:1032 start_codon:yes stop_codon:yes gene_type:complete
MAPKNHKEKILIVGPSWIGDMVMSQSLYNLLKTNLADCELHVLAPKWSNSIIERIPEVTKVINQPVGHGELKLGLRRKVAKSLKKERYSRAIIIPHSFKAALIPFFANIPIRTGFLGELRFGLINDICRFDNSFPDSTINRYITQGYKVLDTINKGFRNPILRVDSEKQKLVLQRLGLVDQKKVVILAPGAEYGLAKRWPIEYFKELAERLDIDGYKVWVMGSEKEKYLGDTILQANKKGNIINLCGKTSLSEVIDLLNYAKIVVTNDSGLMHVASAVNTHIIAIYGSSSPSFTPPLTKKKTILYLDIECSPCFKRECYLRHFKCMKNINVSQVYEIIASGID